MDPITFGVVIGLPLIGLLSTGALFLVAAAGAAIAGYELGRLVYRRPITPPPADVSIAFWSATKNILCRNPNIRPNEPACQTILQLTLNDHDNAVPFTVRIMKRNPSEADFIELLSLTNFSEPGWAGYYDANDPMFFNEGPGLYTIQVQLVRGDTVLGSRELTLRLLDDTKPLFLPWEVANLQSAERFTTTFTLSGGTFEKAIVRGCKNLALTSLSIVNTQFYPSPGNTSLTADEIRDWQAEEDEYSFDASQTEPMLITIVKDEDLTWSGEIAYNGTVVFGPDTDGTVGPQSVTPNPIMLDNEVIVSVQTNYENLDSPPFSFVSTQIFASFECINS